MLAVRSGSCPCRTHSSCMPPVIRDVSRPHPDRNNLTTSGWRTVIEMAASDDCWSTPSTGRGTSHVDRLTEFSAVPANPSGRRRPVRRSADPHHPAQVLNPGGAASRPPPSPPGSGSPGGLRPCPAPVARLAAAFSVKAKPLRGRYAV